MMNGMDLAMNDMNLSTSEIKKAVLYTAFFISLVLEFMSFIAKSIPFIIDFQRFIELIKIEPKSVI